MSCWRKAVESEDIAKTKIVHMLTQIRIAMYQYVAIAFSCVPDLHINIKMQGRIYNRFTLYEVVVAHQLSKSFLYMIHK